MMQFPISKKVLEKKLINFRAIVNLKNVHICSRKFKNLGKSNQKIKTLNHIF